MTMWQHRCTKGDLAEPDALSSTDMKQAMVNLTHALRNIHEANGPMQTAHGFLFACRGSGPGK